ncbi:hypothetical protein HBZS_117650 [Helicobacter bizzozeronii CCUG 35545]|nr:hypothetical protein HBZS_117650 [Helicobacter bizzozeronii CCUG 35545]
MGVFSGSKEGISAGSFTRLESKKGRRERGLGFLGFGSVGIV